MEMDFVIIGLSFIALIALALILVIWFSEAACASCGIRRHKSLMYYLEGAYKCDFCQSIIGASKQSGH